MEEGVPCDFGAFLKDLCHKTYFTKKCGFKDLKDYDPELKEVYFWRAGIFHHEDIDRITKICFHHEWALGVDFEGKYTKCCNIFQNHKKKVKGGHMISLYMAKRCKNRRLTVFQGGNSVEIAMQNV